MAMTTSQQGSIDRGLPIAEFIEDVPAYCKGKKMEDLLEGINQKFQALKVLEQQLGQRRMRLMTKLPEIQKAHDVVTKLLAAQGEELTLDFELSPHVYSKAKLNDVKSVNLWLGAGVMVEYPLEEARDLLVNNLATCKANIATVEEDIGFIKESITTTEVSIARIYNYDVEQRRLEREAGGGGGQAVTSA